MTPLMYTNTQAHGKTADETAMPQTPSEPQRGIIVVAPAAIMSERLVHALRREFPWTWVQQVPAIDAVCASFPVPVSLILLNAPLLHSAENLSLALFTQHPQALTAIIELDDHKPVCSPREILSSRLVRGVLPMNLGLDVWMAVIRLMLCGGEYYPPRMFRSLIENQQYQNTASPPRRDTPFNPPSRTDLSQLTAREMQILEMVSRGMQNKMIATEFQLSEHTVKIHLHHIIRKLGVHNRTEAAARFRNFQKHPTMTI